MIRSRTALSAVASLGLLGGVLPSTASAEETPQVAVLTKTEALDRLRRENLDLIAAKHRLSRARAETVAAGVWPNPNVSANLLFARAGANPGGAEELTAGLNQTVPIAGQVGLRQDVANGLYDAEERAYAENVWQVVNDARVAYLELQHASLRVRVLRAGAADLTRLEKIVAERAASGANPAYDRVRVSVERSKVESGLADAETTMAAARVDLARRIGKSVDARTVTVEDKLDDAADAISPAETEALVKRALDTRPEVKSARARSNAMDLRVSYLRRTYFPSPDIGIAYTRYFDVGNGAGAGGAFIAGLSFPVPLFDHGQGTIDRGLAEAAEVRTRGDATELAIRREVEQATSVLNVRVGAWKRFRETTAPDVERLRSTAELAYREGRASILELVDAYASYVAAEERKVDLQVAAARASLDLSRALGPTAR